MKKRELSKIPRPKATQEMIEKKKSVLGSLDTMIEDGAKEKRNTKYFE